ncbi:MAG: DUF6748 domain-containing protein [Polyangiales bacterium]
MRLTLSLTLSALALAASGCAPVDDPSAEESAADEVRAGGAVFVRVRHDTRRCLSPVCGGWWVSRVNYNTTRCLDGSYARECYVAEIDWRGLGLTERALPAVQEAAGSGRALLRARIEPKAYGPVGTFGELVVQEAWQAVTAAEPSGPFYRVQGPDRVCVRAPCFAYDQDRLNSTQTARLSGVDLSRVAGVTAADLARGVDTLRQPVGILAAGVTRNGADGGRTLVATQFYVRVSEGVSDATYCRADADCVASVYRADVAAAGDCYCRFCPTAVVNATTARARETAYERYCRPMVPTCPVPRCIVPPTPRCVANACVGVTRTP